MKESSANNGESYRLFVAIDIPDEAVAGLAAWQQRFLAGDRALRLTPAAQLHITLVFLGRMGEEQLDQAAGRLDRLEDRSACELTASCMVGLPRDRNPRVIAAAFDGPVEGPRRIHDELAAGLVAKGLCRKEKRPFFPHVTLARSRGRTRVSPARFTPEPVKFTAVRVTLYNSILKPSGAEHRPLKSVQLT